MFICGSLFFTSFSGCAYYNYFYNAKKHYKEGEKQRKEQTSQSNERRRRGGSSNYDKCIESAGRMLEYYPGSKWEPEALLLLAKAFYHTGKYRHSINKVDELIAKYPDSRFSDEAQLWKGVSLLKVAQPDSARQILGKLDNPETPVYIRVQAHFALGEYFYELERWDSAIEQYKEILVMEKVDEWTSGQALISVGECLKKLSKHQEAYDLYTQILTKKSTRRQRFEATFQRAIVQRELGQYTESLEVFTDLLDDAAFTDEFPRIEIEAAKCERSLGRMEDAIKRLERLIEAERRGVIAAEAQYELGLITWEKDKDFAKAITALKGVQQAERSSPFVELADSMTNEISNLSKYWYRLSYLESQIAALDSAKAGLIYISPQDTTFTDSVQLIISETDRSRRGNRNRRGGRNDPLRRMVEEAMEAEAAEQDSLEVAQPDTTAPLDSVTVAELMVSRREDRRNTWYELSQFHMFERNDIDSTKLYCNKLLGELEEGDVWGRTLAILAYIERKIGNEAAHDSLYRVIMSRSTDELFQIQVKKALGLAYEPETTDSLDIIIRLAESTWMQKRDSILARELYLSVADLADSTSEVRARALLAAGYLSLRVIGDLPAAREYYNIVATDFSRELHGRTAREIVKLFPEDTTAAPQVDSLRLPDDFDEMMLEEGLSPDGTFLGTTPNPAWEEELKYEVDDRIYSVDEIDEPPTLTTSVAVMKNLVKSNYPPEASKEGITGMVELEFVVNTRGKASQIEVILEEPDGYSFGEAAEEVLQKLKYRPGRYKGKKVKVKIKQQFTFEEIEE